MKTYYVAGIPYSDELYHHGIKGQKWGIRRYQNPDGTLTEAGKKRYFGKNQYNEEYESASAKGSDRFQRITDKEFKKAYLKSAREDRRSKYGSGEGRPSDYKAASETTAYKFIKNSSKLKESKQELYETLKPELEFETNHKLWKKFGYDPNDKSYESHHDVEDAYYKAREKYMKSVGLAEGSEARKKYENERSWAFEDYNTKVRYTVNDLLGYSGSRPVSVVSKWNNVYYAEAKESINKLLTYGTFADQRIINGGYLDFWSLADDYAKDKGYER